MKVVIIEPLGISDEKLMLSAKESLGDKAELVYYNIRSTDEDELIRRGKDADIIVVSNLPLSERVLSRCEVLKFISVAFTGVDHIPMDYCRTRGITVSNCAGYSTRAVSELVFGMLISMYRNIIPCNEAVRREGTKNGLVGNELFGKKFGIIGTGAIGLRTAAIARAFGCDILAWSRTRKEVEGIQYVELDELLSRCDIVSLHVPLTAETRGLIDEKKLSLMKKNAVLVNTARGPVVDSIALAKALKAEDIAGACIDVFETEPPIPADHPLLTSPHVIATPHVAFATEEALEAREKMVFANVAAFLDGRPINVM
ncbi:NAD(P)-dependent oxidoreductase [Papillibacter cinnamivorans]|uniref:D-3-phosphoglycerate dehydrogenase n=1 Tax=Papillibacter cinnamivorans DSM 12816 TaxID=1122930 RepID=A0A1W2BFL9_9FIRM|nr:NAD(P)-dependent oxidoreductase [Papillibacter cinnamivorans]SMC71641.1 D-3-phosphoglycerate dehydrogenase [Papillibacter cinnamivorans DSM 12816]